MSSKLRIAGVMLATTVGFFGAGGTAGAAPQQDDMKARHEEMEWRHADTVARHEDIAARMTALDERIDLLTQQMNAFVGDARIDAMAKLLTAMIEQNQTMRSAMAEMKGGIASMMESCAMHQKAEPSAAPAQDHTGS